LLLLLVVAAVLVVVVSAWLNYGMYRQRHANTAAAQRAAAPRGAPTTP